MLKILRELVVQQFGTVLNKDPNALLGMLESPKQAGHGQVALPVFAWAKVAKKNPAELAKELASQCQALKVPQVEQVTAISGFVNFSFNPQFMQNVLLEQILNKKAGVGFSAVGVGQKVVIDFSSPNVAKPMHVGHLRATVIGQAIVNLARTQGYEVVGLNHIGDWGTQFGKLAYAYQRWGSEYPFAEKPFESLYKLYVRFHEAAETDPQLESEGARTFLRLEQKDPEIVELWQKFVAISMADYERIYALLKVQHDLVRGESFYNDRLRAVEDELTQKGLLVESDGAMVVPLDDAQMPPCLIRKSDGASLYATRDLASAIYRMEELKANLSLYVVGADQTLHFRQVFKVLEKMGYPWVQQCHHVAFGMYRFKDTRISTRKGNTIFLEDVLTKAVTLVGEIIAQKNPDLQNADLVARQIGVGAVIFNDLVNDRVKNVDFDWDRVLDFEGDSGPYVQYCGVRCRSLLRKYGKELPNTFLTSLNSPEELELMRTMLNYQDVLRDAFRTFKPHILATYLLDLCRRFNQFYTKCRILGESHEIEVSRLTLVQMVEILLQRGLALLSIELPEQM